MRKTIAILFIATLFLNCKNDSKSPVTDANPQEEISAREVSGNFFYYADAAVLQTKSELFGVIENEKAKELIKMAEPLKGNPTDEVSVTLNVKVVKKPEHEEGWENRVEIIDILKVSKVDQKNSAIIKLKAGN